MTKIFHLATCNTCQKILAELDPGPEVVLREIKSAPITEAELDEMYRLAGSYEALFSRRAMKYRQWGLNEKKLSEADYRRYILEEYTFLKRPVVVTGEAIFIGNARKAVEGAKAALAGG
ncbi:MAG: hypothetical protein D6722_00630 [Bacteroidetes bacterium]|nr:MAG: hypothetical protein D6722_00630 [Bacteroidota bacterium]